MAEPQIDILTLRILSNFIHQIINPLNGVIGTVDNLIDGTIRDEVRRAQRLRAVRAQLEWTIVLIRNLAFFTSTTLSPGKPVDVDLSRTCVIPQLVIEAIQFFQEAANSRGIHIELTDRVTQYSVLGSPDLLRQVFMNLIDNAVKYSDADTAIAITPRVQQRTGDLFVEVTNTGIGFSKQEADRLFDEGFRGEEAKSRVASGTGLGLHICKLIVERIHKATITAEYSSVKKTATLRIKFPEWRHNS